MKLRRILAVLVLLSVYPTFFTSPAQATWVQYASSPVDTYNRPELPVEYDITGVDFATDDIQTDKYFFFLQFSTPITPNLFSDGKDSWAGVFLDINNDGNYEYSLQTDASVPYDGAFGHAYKFVDRTGSQPVISTKCSGNTWTNLDKGVSWIGFNILKSCLPFASTIGVDGYTDHISGDNTEFDYAPDNIWQLSLSGGVIAPIGSGSSGSSTSLPTINGGLEDSLSSAANPPNDLVNLSSEIGKSVVTVLCGNSLGSGWSIATELTSQIKSSGYQSYVITNHHVIEECTTNRNIQLILQDQSKVAGYVWAWDSVNDVASIVTKTNIPALDWRGPTPLQGWWVGVIGSPLGYPGILTTGIVSSNNASTYLGTTTAPINHGNSGGPVFDRLGRVIGLATAKYVDSEGFGIFHGTPLLCGKIVVCSSTSQVWTGAITASPSPSPSQASSSSPLALAAVNDYNAMIEKANGYLTLENECDAIGQDLDQFAADIISSSALHAACANEDASIRDYAAKAKDIFENSPANNDQDFKNSSIKFKNFADQVEISGKKITATIKVLNDSLQSFAELGKLTEDTKLKYESFAEKWTNIEDKLSWMPVTLKKSITVSTAYKSGVKANLSLESSISKLDSISSNYVQIDSQSRISTALTSLKLFMKNDPTILLSKSILTVEKLFPKYVCYSDSKVLLLPKTGKCPVGTVKTGTSQ